MRKSTLASAVMLATLVLPGLSVAEDAAKTEPQSVEAAEREQMALMRASIRIEKREYIKNAMDLTDEEGKKFWSIYYQYEADLMKLNDKRQAFIEDYAKNYESITEAKADEIAKKAFEYRKARTSLLEKYYGKLAKAISKNDAARFVQVENVLQAASDVTIGTSIPIMPKVGE